MIEFYRLSIGRNVKEDEGSIRFVESTLYYDTIVDALVAWSEHWRNADGLVFAYLMHMTDIGTPGTPLMDLNFNPLAEPHEAAFIALK